jgi:hypothetical protein
MPSDGLGYAARQVELFLSLRAASRLLAQAARCARQKKLSYSPIYDPCGSTPHANWSHPHVPITVTAITVTVH